MDKEILMNQLVIMEVLLEMTNKAELRVKLKDQIVFTKGLIAALV